jgi:hypothetical protein
MQKIKLLVADSGLTQPWYVPYWQESFDYEPFDFDMSYDTANCVVLIDKRYDRDRYNRIKAQGFRVVCPYIMDSYVEDLSEIKNQDLILRPRDGIMIQESISWTHWNYNAPREPQTPDRFFLLLINQLRPHRKNLLEAVESFLADSLYSCVVQGRLLPDDVYVPIPGRPGTANDRYYVPRWYGETCFSLVSETLGHADRIRGNLLYISEKAFKPIAHVHPFVIQGTRGTLEYLRGLGFETFSHVIDESYDQDPDLGNRLQMITQVVTDLYREFKSTGTVFQDARTQQILEHNRNLFFNQDHMREMFRKQIAEPIIEFYESP